MPPKFSLQSVLDYRHSRVERLEIELGNLKKEEMECRKLLERLLFNQSQLDNRLSECLKGEVDLVTVRHLQSELRTVSNRIKTQKKLLQSLENQVNAKRNELIKAKQDEETLELLKEKELEQFFALEARKEMRLQDDIYNAKAHRNLKERHNERLDSIK